VSSETVRQWSIEFSQYLSPSGQPGSGKQKVFSDSDMLVLSLIAEMKQQRKTYEEIHVALQAGQRGDLPAMPASRVSALATTDREKSLQLQLTFLQQELLKAQEEMKTLDHVKQNLAHEREERLQIQARYDESLKMIGTFQEQLLNLTKQLGREFNEGYKLGLKDAREDENE
jgi:DNA-binding transcriptional MerR regulator